MTRRTLLALLCLGAATARPAVAGLVIVPTFEATITTDANAATIEATINSAIREYETRFTDPITVRITFGEGGGLGQSDFDVYSVLYSDYRAALAIDARSAADATALAHLPIQATSPVDGNELIYLTPANARAVGINIAPASDGTIMLKTSITNLDRTSIDPSKYDLKAVAEHEIDEILGLGSGLNINAPDVRLSRPQDLFRYSAPGVRSYSVSSGATSYLSIDGGTTDLAGFNQGGGGSDYGDFDGAVVRVQNAYGTPGATPDLGVELTNLDVIGYDLATTATPEPSTVGLALMAVSAGAGAWIRGRRRG